MEKIRSSKPKVRTRSSVPADDPLVSGILAPTPEDEEDANVQVASVRFRAGEIPLNDSVVMRLIYYPVKRSIVWIPGDLLPGCDQKAVKISVRGSEERRMRNIPVPAIMNPRTKKPMTLGEISDNKSAQLNEVKIKPMWYQIAYLWDVVLKDDMPKLRGGRPVVFQYGYMIYKAVSALRQNKVLGPPSYDPIKGRDGYDITVVSVKEPGDQFQSYQVQHNAGNSFTLGKEQREQIAALDSEINQEMHDVMTITEATDALRLYSSASTSSQYSGSASDYDDDEDDDDDEAADEEDWVSDDDPYEDE